MVVVLVGGAPGTQRAWPHKSRKDGNESCFFQELVRTGRIDADTGDSGKDHSTIPVYCSRRPGSRFSQRKNHGERDQEYRVVLVELGQFVERPKVMVIMMYLTVAIYLRAMKEPMVKPVLLVDRKLKEQRVKSLLDRCEYEISIF